MPASDGDSDGQHPPTPTRSVLPALTFFLYKGDSKYVEDLLACIDTPVKYQFSFKVSHSFKVAAADGFQKNIITNLNKYIKL